MQNLSSVYFVKHLYMFRAYLLPIIRRFQPSQDNRQSFKENNKYQLLYPYGVPPDDGLQICPKHVEVFDEIY